MSIEAYLDYAFDPAPRDPAGAVIGTTSADAPPPPPPGPCSREAPVDDAAAGAELSAIDFAGARVGSLQPFRWNVTERTLSYQTRLSTGFTLQLRLSLPRDGWSMAETVIELADWPHMVLLGPLRPGSRAEIWSGRGGTVRVTPLAGCRVRLDLSDVSLVNEGEGPPLPAASGSIVGAWIDEH